MGGYMETAAKVVSAVAVPVGIVGDIYGSYMSTRDYNRQLEAAQQQQATMQQMASGALSTAEATTDQEALARARGIYDALLAGREPYELQPFKTQFDEIEAATQAKVRDAEVTAEAARRQIASTIPSGGLKLRMLADIALKTQDKIGAIKGEARDALVKLNTTLKNEYMNKALAFGEKQPTNLMDAYKTAGTLGYYGAAMTGDMLRAQAGQVAGATGRLEKLGESIATLGNKFPTSTTGQISVVGGQPQTTPNALKYTEPFNDEDYQGRMLYGGR